MITFSENNVADGLYQAYEEGYQQGVTEERQRILRLFEIFILNVCNPLKKMRNPTEEERESINKYIEKHSINTGINIFDLLNKNL